MLRRVFDFRVPDRFVAGTVGEPGNRTFFLQAQKGTAVVSVVLEKAQVLVLAERLSALLAEMQRRGVAVPDGVPVGETDDGPLAQPLVEAFRVGTMTLSWDGDQDHVVIEARAQPEDDEDEDDEDDEDEDDEDQVEDDVDEAAAVEDAEPLEFDDDDPAGPDLVRVRLAVGRARAFAARALEVVAAGRPPCPLCGRPLDPGGHVCPRRNGYVH